MSGRRLGFGLFTLLMATLFVGLGLWQLQRRAEKHALVAALNERLAAVPLPLPPPSQWSRLTRESDEFRRVRLVATYAHAPDAMVFSSGSAVREDVSGPGTWAFLPARLGSGETLVVNAGFVPNTMQDQSVEDRAVEPMMTGQPVTMTGYLRFPERPGLFTPSESLGKRLWFARDHLAMASQLGWGTVAPFYVDLEAPMPASGLPKPGPLSVHLTDDHLQYAITWFALAAVIAIALAVWLRRQERMAS
jgi:cytochrome oxidase assembly protein ShyY1